LRHKIESSIKSPLKSSLILLPINYLLRVIGECIKPEDIVILYHVPADFSSLFPKEKARR
jgi:hypothetical protein